MSRNREALHHAPLAVGDRCLRCLGDIPSGIRVRNVNGLIHGQLVVDPAPVPFVEVPASTCKLRGSPDLILKRWVHDELLVAVPVFLTGNSFNHGLHLAGITKIKSCVGPNVRPEAA